MVDMCPKVGDVVLPGDTFSDISSHKNMTFLGPGLRGCPDSKTLIVTKAGILCHKPQNTYWVENQQKRYIPKKGDLVVGIVSKKAGDTFKIDIGAAEQAALPSLAFEGATKKQKPDLQVGDAVYAKLLSAHREMEPELVCIDKYSKAGNMGPLNNNGFIINVNNSLVYKLLDAENPLLSTLGKKYVFEIAIGMNGKIWINSKGCKDTLALMNALYAAEKQSDKDINDICRRYV